MIVGIGASAGGLEALEQFLQNVPADSGMAFVIVQHQDPNQKGMLVELLQRVTRLKVSPVRDRTRARPNGVYVLPPNKDLSILHGVLHLLDVVPVRGVRMPIDFFLRALARDQQGLGAGILLSGMGTDGTLGLRAIKEHAGITLAQDPATAQFSGMPRSAIDAGLADIVAPATALPARLIAYRQHAVRTARPEHLMDEANRGALGKVLVLLRARTGNDFSLYRQSTLHRRIERRMGVHQIERMTAYVRYLQENPQEVEILFKELLIGVTSFFRDPAAWERLRTEVLPALFAGCRNRQTLRAWVAGCSTGEEAYSLAIVFKEALQEVRPEKNLALQIYATDLDQEAINVARHGLYPENIAADVPAPRLRRFFAHEPQGYRVSKEVREMVIFAPQNLIMDPPFTRLDLLSCRNLLIYLMPELQRKLLPLFHYSLNPGGVLFLGSAESVGDSHALFASLSPKERLFRRLEVAGRRGVVEFPAGHALPAADLPGSAPAPEPAAANLQVLTEQFLLRHHSPPAVLVNADGDILYVSGRTGRFLEPATGKADWNVLAMAREELRYDLAGALHKACRERCTVTRTGLRVHTDGRSYALRLTVQALTEPPAMRNLALIVFGEEPSAAGDSDRTGGGKSPASRARVAELAHALEEARREVQASREEMQSSQEELKSMNEELQSANEELQSTNEELTTSKEELQSLNEELQTVNAELQSKLEELSGANNDMKNLLNSTNIATVFLDEALRVRRFTNQANQLFKFIPGDVGRPITDLATDLCYPDLAADSREVLRTLASVEKTIATADGRWFGVRIMPYRTIDNRIDGVVMTFSDVTAAKRLELELRGRCSPPPPPAVRSGT